jgi:glutamine---fructose-6-phosphate transaminase (isomerizing)
MCGIFGVICERGISHKRYLEMFEKMGYESLRRGKDSSGISVVSKDFIDIFKSPNNFSKLWKVVKPNLQTSRELELQALIGHTRMTTHGSENDQENNHPVLAKNWLVFHNGIIVNDCKLRKNIAINQIPEVDTASLAYLLAENFEKKPISDELLGEIVNQTRGANTFVFTNSSLNRLYLWTSNGSMYLIKGQNGSVFFASEETTLDLMRKSFHFEFKDSRVEKLSLGNLFGLNFPNSLFSKSVSAGEQDTSGMRKIRLRNDSVCEGLIKSASKKEVFNVVNNKSRVLNSVISEFDAIAESNTYEYCSFCLMPGNYPGNFLDEAGKCHFCNLHSKTKTKNMPEFNSLLQSITQMGRILVPFSGGRDSAFVLHCLKKEFEIPVVAFTYDWGFVTDIARTNISRLCGDLQVEHILVAADIKRKRENVRRNLMAWIKNPNPGMVPIFMAGDKTFFYHARKTMNRMNINTAMWGMNKLEVAHFKSALAGSGAVTTRENAKNTYDITTSAKLKMALFYVGNFLRTPSYINRSILDTTLGMYSYYFSPVNYLQFYDYFEWNEKQIIEVLVKEYGFEVRGEANLGWRMGDATAPFYNLIYRYFLGYNENNVLVSNLIRDGQISLKQGKERLSSVNTADIEGIVKYFRLVEIDPEEYLSTLLKSKSRIKRPHKV